jgi:hypothetical protein
MSIQPPAPNGFSGAAEAGIAKADAKMRKRSGVERWAGIATYSMHANQDLEQDLAILRPSFRV